MALWDNNSSGDRGDIQYTVQSTSTGVDLGSTSGSLCVDGFAVYDNSNQNITFQDQGLTTGYLSSSIGTNREIYIRDPMPKENVISFHDQNGYEAGKIRIKDGNILFEGNFDESAEQFMERLEKWFDGRVIKAEHVSVSDIEIVI